jgi:hypothetical protein
MGGDPGLGVTRTLTEFDAASEAADPHFAQA